MSAGLMGDGTHRKKRWTRMLEGERNLGQTSLQLALVGESDPVKAERELLEMLPALIRPEGDEQEAGDL